jgi:hypothetical protein
MELKKRHGCFIGWLVITTILGILKILVMLFKTDTYIEKLPKSLPENFITVALILNIALIACVIALYQLKKWAFWGIVIFTTIGSIIALYVGYPILRICLSILWIVLLYVVMQLKKDKVSAWQDLN